MVDTNGGVRSGIASIVTEPFEMLQGMERAAVEAITTLLRVISVVPVVAVGARTTLKLAIVPRSMVFIFIAPIMIRIVFESIKPLSSCFPASVAACPIVTVFVSICI